MNILDTIIEYKQSEVSANKSSQPESVLKKRDLFSRETLSLKKFLSDDRRTGIIAEFKRKSPSKGIINDQADVTAVTTAYANHGASALSILTDRQFFGGQNEDLIAARVNQLPILRKDFIIDKYQVLEARAIGADAILLIATCLSPDATRELASFAKTLQLEILLEIHDETEFGHICDEIDILGINNRDLKTFAVDAQRSVMLSSQLTANKIMISESGINDVDTIMQLKKSGFKGFLIGEHFMKQPDPAIAFASFVNQLKKRCYESESLRHDTT